MPRMGGPCSPTINTAAVHETRGDSATWTTDGLSGLGRIKLSEPVAYNDAPITPPHKREPHEKLRRQHPGCRW